MFGLDSDGLSNLVKLLGAISILLSGVLGALGVGGSRVLRFIREERMRSEKQAELFVHEERVRAEKQVELFVQATSDLLVRFTSEFKLQSEQSRNEFHVQSEQTRQLIFRIVEQRDKNLEQMIDALTSSAHAMERVELVCVELKNYLARHNGSPL